MKQLLIILLSVTLSISLFAQENQKSFTGGFGGPQLYLSPKSGRTIFVVGGGGGCLFRNRYFIGGFGENLVNNLTNSGSFPVSHLELSHGGFWLGYVHKIERSGNLFLSVQLGFGRSYQLKNAALSYFSDYQVIKPMLEYEYVLTHYFKIGTGFTWMFYMNSNIPAWTNNDLSGPALMLTFKFGWF